MNRAESAPEPLYSLGGDLFWRRGSSAVNYTRSRSSRRWANRDTRGQFWRICCQPSVLSEYWQLLWRRQQLLPVQGPVADSDAFWFGSRSPARAVESARRRARRLSRLAEASVSRLSSAEDMTSPEREAAAAAAAAAAARKAKAWEEAERAAARLAGQVAALPPAGAAEGEGGSDRT